MNEYKIYLNDGSSITVHATNTAEAEWKAKQERPGRTVTQIIYKG